MIGWRTAAFDRSGHSRLRKNHIWAAVPKLCAECLIAHKLSTFDIRRFQPAPLTGQEISKAALALASVWASTEPSRDGDDSGPENAFDSPKILS